MQLWKKLSLVQRILAAVIIGMPIGWFLGKLAPDNETIQNLIPQFKLVSDLILQVLRLLATPLIFLSLLHSLLSIEISGKKAGRLLTILMTNTVIAILVGLVVANIVQPGKHIQLITEKAPDKKPFDPVADLIGKVPKDFLSAFSTNDIIGVILIALAIGLAIRKFKSGEHAGKVKSLQDWVDFGLKVTTEMLHWVFNLVPLAVFAVVIRVVATAGIEKFLNLIWFVLSVVAALAIMAVFYLVRLRLSSRFTPAQFIKGGAEAFALAFSTASSAATLPVTYRCATEKLGLSEDSASLGVMVGGTFNHDGTALYEAMAALMISQAMGAVLPVGQQAIVVFMAVIASVGAAGIPEAGLVTMIAVFNAVHLPIEHIPMLLTVDWFLDRCRTTINVFGDLASTCIVDGPGEALNNSGA